MTFPNNQLVTAADLNGGAMVLLSSASLSGTEPSITLSIPVGFPRIKVFWRLRGDNASAGVQTFLNLNGDGSGDQLWQVLQGNNTTAGATASGGVASEMQIATISGGSATNRYFASGEFTIDGANDVSNYKTITGIGSAFATPSNSWAGVFAGMWASLNQVTSLTIFPGAGNLVAGSTASAWGLAA